MLKELWKVLFQDSLDRMTVAEVHEAGERGELTVGEVRRVTRMQMNASKLS